MLSNDPDLRRYVAQMVSALELLKSGVSAMQDAILSAPYPRQAVGECSDQSEPEPLPLAVEAP